MSAIHSRINPGKCQPFTILEFREIQTSRRFFALLTLLSLFYSATFTSRCERARDPGTLSTGAGVNDNRPGIATRDVVIFTTRAHNRRVTVPTCFSILSLVAPSTVPFLERAVWRGLEPQHSSHSFREILRDREKGKPIVWKWNSPMILRRRYLLRQVKTLIIDNIETRRKTSLRGWSNLGWLTRNDDW